MKLDRAILHQRVEDAVPLLALQLIVDARRAAKKLTADGSSSSLHDFRVALRRLRSWLRAFQDELPSITRKHRDALGDVARATNLGRDIDVQLAQLRRAARELRGKARRGASDLAQRLTIRQRGAARGVDAAVLAKFNRTASLLEKRLGTYSPAPAARGKRKRRSRSLASALAATIRAHADDLARALKKVRSPRGERAAHRARIAAKRVRYLVEALPPLVGKAKGVLRSLRKMQDELGALNDSHVLAGEVRGIMRAPDAELLALADHVRGETATLFRVVRKHWLGSRIALVRRDVQGVAQRVDAL